MVLSANDSLGCVHTDSLLVLFSQTFSLNEIGATISIYPNPVQDILWIEKEGNEHLKLELYSSFGAKVMEVDFRDAKNQVPLQLPSGLYWIYLNGLKLKCIMVQ